MQYNYLKDLRAIAILTTSFGLDLVKQQIAVAKEFADVLLGASSCAAQRRTPPISPAGTAAQANAASSFGRPAIPDPSSLHTGEASGERAATPLPGKPPLGFGELRRRSEPFAIYGSDRRLKSMATAPQWEEPVDGPAALHEERAAVAMHDPLPSCPDVQLSFHARVEKRAYELWESEGRPDGSHLRHWLAAEREVREHAAPGRALRPAA